MSTSEYSDVSASSDWKSYISSSPAASVLDRPSSWMTSRFTLATCQDASTRRSTALSSLQLPVTLESQHSLLSTTVVERGSYEERSEGTLLTAPSLIDRSLLDNADSKQHNPSVFLFSPPTVTHPDYWESSYTYYTAPEMATEQRPNMHDLITRLGSDEDALRKMAAFKLQSLINDPAFAEVFIQEDGLSRLRWLILKGSGNTLAYALASFARLLELDLTDNRGWECADGEVIERVVELVVCHPLVNILRGAMAILVSIVSRPYQGEHTKPSPTPGAGGFRALKPAISIYPQFLEMLVSRLSSADHALCANSLQLINSLMRDAITGDPSGAEWPKFIKRLQDLGVIKAAYVLMQSSALQDLAHPLLEFQALTKVLLRRWRDIPVDLLKPEHRRTIKGIHLASKPEPVQPKGTSNSVAAKTKHNPYKWRRLGFSTETPEPDFHDMGFLGMMDLADFVRSHQDEFQSILAEQANQPPEQRCPIARASLVVTAVLYEHFEVDRHDWEESKAYMQLESRTNFGKVFKPLLLQWSRLHTAGLRAYLRLWKATGAKLGEGEGNEGKDFTRVLELVRILVESVVGGAGRSQGVDEVEKEMEGYEVGKLRGLQMELLELTYEDVWGQHLRGVREELMSEALQFVKEQRVRCLLAGAWFPISLGYSDANGGGHGPIRESGLRRSVVSGGWRFVRLDEQRKHLHYGDYDEVQEITPEVQDLEGRIDLAIVSSVVSNVTAAGSNGGSRDSVSSESTVRDLSTNAEPKLTTTKITIHGYLPETKGRQHKHKPSTQSHHTRTTSRSSSRAQSKESVLLTVHPQSQMVASEWLDGLLMLLDQQPITAETNRLVQMTGGFGVRVRLLNVRSGDGEDMAGEDGAVQVPSRQGLDGEAFYYKM